jgi:hypothetical protein
MKKTLIILGLFFLAHNSYSQIGGLSASKLGTLNTDAVPARMMEFEPFFSYASTNHTFDTNGIIHDLFETSDSILFFSSFGFRFSYGLFKDFEIGISVPVDVSIVSYGAKYKLPFKSKFTFALMGGYNSIVGNSIYVKRNSSHESTSAVVSGLIVTYDLSDKFSCDFNVQYQKHINITAEGHTRGVFINSDIGYYFIENVNFILGLNYFFKEYDTFENNSHLFTLNPGVTIERAKKFILVLNAPLDLIGKNEYKTTGFGLALTIMLN